MGNFSFGVARSVRHELFGRSKGTAWLASLLIASSTGFAQSSGGISAITVVGKSATQAVLSYTAPDNNACRVEVSETSNYTPLVRDVDPTLFASSDSDQRAGSVFNATKRTFVVGKRTSETALNSKVYSRALQAATQHYVRVTCGSSIGTATFTTSNIPFGTTYLDLPPVKMPTIETGVPMVDEQTGGLVKVAAPESNHLFTAFASLSSAGQYQVCNPEVVGPDNGYLCAFLTATGGGPGVAYYYVPATGEMRYLGSYITTSSPGTDGWDGHVVGYPQPGRVTYNEVPTHSGKYALLKGTYSGNYQSATPGAYLPMTWTQVYIDGGDMATALRNFNPAVTATSCGSLAVESNWLLIDCRSGIQDTYPYAIGIIDLTTGRAIAARNMMTKSPTRFCGEHNFHFMVSGSAIPIIELSFHGLTAGGTTRGGGPYTLSLTSPITAGQTTISVSGDPQARSDDLPMQMLPGDYLYSSSTHEYMKVVNRISSTQLQVERGAIAGEYWKPADYNAGELFSADCGVPGTGGGWANTYWRFQADPMGDNLIVNRLWQGGAHDDAGPNLHLTEGYGFAVGPIDTLLDKGQQFTISAAPTFAGVGARTDGNTTAMHPAFRQVSDPTWFTDSRPFNGGSLQSDVHTRVSGSLIKYTFPAWFLDSGIHPKILPTLSFTQGTMLKDVSRQGSFISDGPDMPNTYCRALIDGECRSNSKAGDLFANIPDLQILYCAGSDTPNTAFHDWCALDNPPLGQSVLQVGLAANRVGVRPDQPSTVYGLGWTRPLTRGFGSVRAIGQLAKATPDGKWLLFNQRINNGEGTLLMVKAPPFQAEDSIDRTNFFPAMIAVPGNSQAASAVVQFGYAEQGTPGQYFCTSRQESCVAISGTINATDPFKYKDTEHYTGVPCASGCQIAVPLAPQHVAYFQILYLNASGQVISLGSQGVVTEDASSSLPPPPPGVNVTLNPPGATLSSAQTAQFTATVTNTSNTAVTWSLNPSVGTLSNGLYTAPSTVSSNQSVTVTATSVADPTKFASATIQLSTTASVGVSLSPSTVTLTNSQTRQFTPTVTGTTNTSVTWSLSPNVGSVSNGLYTAPSGINSAQSVTIKATSSADPTKSGSATIQLVPTVNISVSPLSVTLAPSQTYQFTATVTGTTNTAVTWSMAPSAGSLSNGLYTAPSTVSVAQNITITATSTADPTKSSTATVQLVPDVVSISMTPSLSTLAPSQSKQITATVTGTSNTGVVWSTPPVGTLSNGLYTAPSSVNTAQNVVITATSQADPTKVGSATVQLMPNVGITVTPTSAILAPSQGRIFTASVTGTTNTGVTWSMAPSVGTLSNGTYTAPSVITTSQIVIVTATSTVDPTKSSSASVQLVPNDLTVTLNPLNVTLIPTQTTQFMATVTGSGNTAVSWSMNPSVGTLLNGLYTAPSTITANQAVTITATSVADPSKSGTATIQLTPNQISVKLDPPSASLLSNETTQFTATVTGTSYTAVTWSMSPATGTLVNGLYRAPATIKSSSNLTITATSVADPTKSTTATIHLLPKNINIKMSPQKALVAAAQSVRFTAQVDGTTEGTVIWSNNGGLGSMTSNGIYTAPNMVSTPQDVTITGTLLPPDGAPVATTAVVTVVPSSDPDGTPTVTWAINAASLGGGPIAPGEILAVVGSGMGPHDAATLTLDDSGMVAVSLAGTRVLFDGVPAPLLYVQSGQINVVVPYSVTPGSTVKVQVEYHGVLSNAITLSVASYSPGLFTLGGGQGAIVNQDGSVNSADNPAPRDSWVSMYGTGIGQTIPPGVDGQVVGTPPGQPVTPISVTIGGKNAEVLYSGSVPGMVSGVLLINVRIPADAPTGYAVPIIFGIGGGLSQPGVTIAVK